MSKGRHWVLVVRQTPDIPIKAHTAYIVYIVVDGLHFLFTGLASWKCNRQ
jgi:hypothetical protein